MWLILIQHVTSLHLMTACSLEPTDITKCCASSLEMHCQGLFSFGLCFGLHLWSADQFAEFDWLSSQVIDKPWRSCSTGSHTFPFNNAPSVEYITNIMVCFIYIISFKIHFIGTQRQNYRNCVLVQQMYVSSCITFWYLYAQFPHFSLTKQLITYLFQTKQIKLHYYNWHHGVLHLPVKYKRSLSSLTFNFVVISGAFVWNDTSEKLEADENDSTKVNFSQRLLVQLDILKDVSCVSQP